MRANVSSRVATFNQALQRFENKWSASKPQDGNREAALNAVAVIKERRAEFDELCQQYATLQHDCEHFSVDAPQSVEALRQAIEEASAVWLLFEEVCACVNRCCLAAVCRSMFDNMENLRGGRGLMRVVLCSIIFTRFVSILI